MWPARLSDFTPRDGFLWRRQDIPEETKNLKNKTVEFAIRIRKTGENITKTIKP